MSLSVEAQVNALNAKLREYQAASGKTWEDVLQKQGGKLGFLLFERLRGIAPRKGEVRAERLAALRHGEGIRVRQSARDFATRHTLATASKERSRKASLLREKGRSGKLKAGGRNWWQIAVAREIAIRESGRGFIAQSGHYPRSLGNEVVAASRFGPVLSRAGIQVAGSRGRAQFIWDPAEGELAAKAVAGLSKPKGRAMVALALRDLLEDIDVYVIRKQEERIGNAGLK